jgi:hypothetical protein
LCGRLILLAVVVFLVASIFIIILFTCIKVMLNNIGV